MMIKFYFTIVLCFFAAAVSAQQSITLDNLKSSFELFDYDKVIKNADSLLIDKYKFTEEELIAIYTYKAIAHYSLGDNNLSKDSFIEILKIDENHSLDPVATSPKIIAIYEELKRDYKQIVPPEETEIKSTKIDTVVRVDTLFIRPDNKTITGPILKSILLPGWGHLSSGDDTKGWLLTSASTLTLGSMIYFIFDTNTKRNSYLNEIDQILIDQKYDKFNTSYKIRNTLIAAYIAIWIYSQLDLMIFSSDILLPGLNESSINYSSQVFSEIQFHFSFRL
jgi:hypothetical protein